MPEQQNQRWAIGATPQRRKPLPRLVLMGEPGIGKTSFGISAEDAVLIPTEDGALGTDAPRLPTDGKCESWEDLLHAVRVLLDAEHDFRWAVVDTLNAAEHLCAESVCRRDFGGVWTAGKGQEGYNSFGKGEKASAQELRRLLVMLDSLQQRRGMGVILLAHVGLHKQANALGPDFTKFGADIGRHSWAAVCSWADQVGYACREVRSSVRDGEKMGKASAIGSERWILWEGGPGLDAKSRVGYKMPARTLLSWDEYEAALNADPVGALVAQATELLTECEDDDRRRVQERLGGNPSAERLRQLGKQRLEALVGWLLSRQHAKTSEEG